MSLQSHRLSRIIIFRHPTIYSVVFPANPPLFWLDRLSLFSAGFTHDSLNVDTTHRPTRAQLGLNVKIGGSYNAGLRHPLPVVHRCMQVIIASTMSASRMLIITLLLRACSRRGSLVLRFRRTTQPKAAGVHVMGTF
jgi:hypothetical protein